MLIQKCLETNATTSFQVTKLKLADIFFTCDIFTALFSGGKSFWKVSFWKVPVSKAFIKRSASWTYLEMKTMTSCYQTGRITFKLLHNNITWFLNFVWILLKCQHWIKFFVFLYISFWPFEPWVPQKRYYPAIHESGHIWRKTFPEQQSGAR